MKKLCLLLKIAVIVVSCAVFCGCGDVDGNGTNPPGHTGTSPWSGQISQFGDVGPRANTGGNDPADGIYVSPDGNDSIADGSISAPYKSINAALEGAPSGSTIILRGGTYREGRDVRVRRSNITIKSAKGEWAIIDLTTFNPGNDEHSGVEFYAEDEDTNGIVTGGKLQSVEVMGGFYAVGFDTKWDWEQADRSGASNIIIEDCVLHDSRNDVIKIKPGCDDITIRYNEIYNSGREHSGHPDFNSGERNSEGIDNVNGARMHVHNNYIHDICSNGVYAKGGAVDALIENNRIERTYGAGIMVGFDTSPEFFDIAVNPKYYENVRGIVRNNLTIDTGWEGIGLYASMDAQVYNNTIVNAVSYGTGLYHSPIYFGVATQDEENPAGCPPNINPSIHHNIVSQPSSYNDRMIDIRYIPAGNVYSHDLSALSGNPTMNNNCYYVAGKNATFTDNRPGSILDSAPLDAWRAHISGESSSIEVDPALGADYVAANAQCTGMGIQP
ncbi:MAG: right-handed parallel beta-helix repeat-containing protein [Treponema sp.]|nr:right-handed parallel beta-helix repeat-containing protein [Treponema sp.]